MNNPKQVKFLERKGDRECEGRIIPNISTMTCGNNKRRTKVKEDSKQRTPKKTFKKRILDKILFERKNLLTFRCTSTFFSTSLEPMKRRLPFL